MQKNIKKLKQTNLINVLLIGLQIRLYLALTETYAKG